MENYRTGTGITWGLHWDYPLVPGYAKQLSSPSTLLRRVQAILSEDVLVSSGPWDAICLVWGCSWVNPDLSNGYLRGLLQVY